MNFQEYFEIACFEHTVEVEFDLDGLGKDWAEIQDSIQEPISKVSLNC